MLWIKHLSQYIFKMHLPIYNVQTNAKPYNVNYSSRLHRISGNQYFSTLWLFIDKYCTLISLMLLVIIDNVSRGRRYKGDGSSPFILIYSVYPSIQVYQTRKSPKKLDIFTVIPPHIFKNFDYLLVIDFNWRKRIF